VLPQGEVSVQCALCGKTAVSGTESVWTGWTGLAVLRDQISVSTIELARTQARQHLCE
jgi:hypothetical protein